MKRIVTLFLTVLTVLVVVFPVNNDVKAVTTELNGVYYFRNAVVGGSFIDVENAGNGTAVQTHNLVNTRLQTWTVTPIGNGYYKIMANCSGYYLTVVNNSTSYGNNVVVTSYTGESGQQWLISKNSQTDIYSFHPRCNPNGYLSAPIESSFEGELPYNGTTLGIYHESPDARDQEKWYLHKMTSNTLVVKADYDDAYASRYGASNVSSRIDDVLLKLKRVMLQYAGIKVEFNNNHYNVDTYLDTSSCAAKNNHSTMCTCGSCNNSTASSLKSFHHTNFNNILYRMDNPNQANSLKVIFSGHDMCVINNSSHVASTKNACIHSAVYEEKDIILMFDFYTQVLYHEHMIMVKDILGLYGLVDHFEQDENTTGGFSDNCIFGYNSHTADVVEVCTLCEHCQGILLENISTYNHVDN